MISPSEFSLTAIRSSGAGGQHVNKVSTGILLSFDIQASSLPDEVKMKLLSLNDQRISNSGVIQIKATTYRSQLKNKKEAISRLKEMIMIASKPKKKRKKTTLPKAVSEARRKEKSMISDKKAMRKKPTI